MLKILVSAYSCEPNRGSEPGVGWNVVRELAKYHQVWVLTRPDESETAIRAELDRHPIPNLHFIYFTTPILGSLWKWNQNGAMQIHYYLWQLTAYWVGRRLHRQIGFDLIQHVTFVKYSSPSFLSLLPVPFVWGPVGGGESIPAAFWQDLTGRQRLYEMLRSIARWLGERDPFTRLTAQRSVRVFATTPDTAARLQQLGRSTVQILPESGLSQAELLQFAQYPAADRTPVRFISMGRLLHWKGVQLGLRAFAQAQLPEAAYWIVGDGAEQLRLQQLAIALGIAPQVQFFGRLPRSAALKKLADCQVLVHPSLHDSGGWVCLEAMAAGRPVICLALGGAAQQVTPATGYSIAAQTPEQAVADLAGAMKRLAIDPALRLQMGQAGRQRVEQYYTWEAKGKLLNQLYETIVPSSSSDPIPHHANS